MQLLEKLGLARKKKPFSPIKDNKATEKGWEQNPWIKASIFVGFLAGVLIVFPRYTQPEVSFQVNEPWRQEDVTAPYDFSLLKTEDELNKEREEIRQLAPPIFHLDETARIRIQSRLDSLFKNLQPVLDSYLVWKTGPEMRKDADSLNFLRLKNKIPVGLSDEAWQPLLESYLLVHSKNNRANRFAGIDIRLKVEFEVNQLLLDGIINVSKSDLENEELTIRNLRERTEKTVFKANVRDLPEARQYAHYRFSRTLSGDHSLTANQIFDLIIEANLIFNDRATQARINEALDEVSPTKGAVAQGTTIIRRGDILTAEKVNMLQSLIRAQTENASETDLWLKFLGDVIVTLSIFTIFFWYLYLYRKQIYDYNSRLFIVFVTHFLIVGIGAFIFQFDSVNSYLIPVGIASVLLTVIFDSRVGIFTAVTLSMLTALMHGNEFDYLIATLTASSLAVYSVRDIKNRAQFFFTTPLLIFASYTFVIAGFSLSNIGAWETIDDKILMSLLNALLTFFAYPLILLYEKMFRISTDVTWMEMTDTNRPVLKALMMRAPGTFHHSLQVANLSEAAASQIGANALLCRVGCLYHDIGKMEKAEYFSENQSGDNPMDKLKPMMSVRIIKSHVSSGVKMAVEEGLPKEIINFIETHHGTSIIKYFHDKAKNLSDNESEIHESDFRYDGPLPETKETGIALLADGIEATARSMKDPNYAKLESMINRQIDERVADGQLSKTPLTFADLNLIKKSFLNILVGMYHGRVKYPGQEEQERKEELAEKAAEKESAKPADQQTDEE